MSTPQLGPVHAQLAALVGTWEGKEQLATTPWSPGGTARGEHSFAVTAGGFALVQEYAEHRDGAPMLTGHGVFSVDPSDGCVVWFWFDSIGYPPLTPSRGSFASDGTTLRVEKTTPRGVQRASFAIAGEVLVHRIEVRLPEASEFACLVDARYERCA